ncbi:MAG: ankyrin repeat domain-containing protein [Elusimicrobiota bacterium]|jgi:ankyrin repeat protein|nr:ankyrin repeat domain-containing protein [Elusimicrobiota bacterium]
MKPKKVLLLFSFVILSFILFASGCKDNSADENALLSEAGASKDSVQVQERIERDKPAMDSPAAAVQLDSVQLQEIQRFFEDNKPPLLITAAANGDKDVVSRLLKEGADPNMRHFHRGINPGGETALMAASRAGHKAIVSILLEAKADPNINSYLGQTALSMASSNGDKEIVSMLLKAGADPNSGLWNAKVRRHEEIVSMLLSAGAQENLSEMLINAISLTDIPLIEEFIKKGADVNALIYTERPLTRAVSSGQKEIVSMLLKAKADPNLPAGSDRENSTALMSAAARGDKEIVSILLSAGADPNLQNSKGYTALLYARRHEEIISMLLAAGAEAEVPVKSINNIIVNEDIDLLEKFIKGGDINARTENSETPLIIAANHGRKEIVSMLLKAKANPNLQSSDGSTALIIASFREGKEIVSMLLNAGADPNLQKSDGSTALMLTSNKEIVSMLLNAGADPDLKGSGGRTALKNACWRDDKEIVYILLKAGATSDYLYDINGYQCRNKEISDLLSNAEAGKAVK